MRRIVCPEGFALKSLGNNMVGIEPTDEYLRENGLKRSQVIIVASPQMRKKVGIAYYPRGYHVMRVRDEGRAYHFELVKQT